MLRLLLMRCVFYVLDALSGSMMWMSSGKALSTLQHSQQKFIQSTR